MFNLEKAITLWKNEFKENDSFTNEDIEELEGHLLDKIDSLTKSGLTQEEAFIKANENIGTAEVLHNDFSIVNKIGILTKRMILGLFGYIFIVFLNDIVRLLTISIILPFAKSLMDIPVSKNSLFGVIMNIMLGSSYSNMLVEVSIVISSILSIILIYLVVSNKLDIINRIIRMVNKNIYSKSNLSIPKVISGMIMATLLVIFTPFIGNIISGNSYPNEMGSIVSGIYISKLGFDFMIAFIFIYKLYGKSRLNKNLLVSLGGYLTANSLIIIIPLIVETIIFSTITTDISIKLIYFLGYLLVMAIFVLIIIGINKRAIYKENTNKKLKYKSFKMRTLLGLIISFIYVVVNLFIVPLKLYLIGTTRVMQVMGQDNFMQLVIIVIAQFIVSIIMIRKIKMYRKVA